jgi:hypothetical protein
MAPNVDTKLLNMHPIPRRLILILCFVPVFVIAGFLILLQSSLEFGRTLASHFYDLSWALCQSAKILWLGKNKNVKPGDIEDEY